MDRSLSQPGATRRQFLAHAAVGITAARLSARAVAGAKADDGLIDAHVYLGRWPFGRLANDEPARLADALRSAGATQAWAGSFDALLHKDVAAVNARLAAACKLHGDGLFLPIGAVNPTLPDWEDDLRRCHQQHGMRGIRLHPSWHGYGLDDHRFERLLRLAADRHLTVQLVCSLTHHEPAYVKSRFAAVDLAPLVVHLRRLTAVQLVLINHADSAGDGNALRALAAMPNVFFGVRRRGESAGGLMASVPSERRLFASAAPLHSIDSMKTD